MQRSKATTIIILFFALAGCALTHPGGPQIKQASINGTKLTYQAQGQGRPVVFVHGAITDRRVWEGQREAVTAHNRFIALTMRYFGTDPWPDAGANYSMKTHTDDLVAFIQNLNAGPVDLIGWSYSGPIALLVAVQHPELVRSLFLDEPSTLALVTDQAELKAATQDRTTMTGPAAAAVKAGDTAGAVKSLFNGVNGQPDLFDTVPAAVRTMLLDNARTSSRLHGSRPGKTWSSLRKPCLRFRAWRSLEILTLQPIFPTARRLRGQPRSSAS